jgi:hypothetical protein
VGSNPTISATDAEVTPISWTDVTIYGGTFMLIPREPKPEIVKTHLLRRLNYIIQVLLLFGCGSRSLY